MTAPNDARRCHTSAPERHLLGVRPVAAEGPGRGGWAGRPASQPERGREERCRYMRPSDGDGVPRFAGAVGARRSVGGGPARSGHIGFQISRDFCARCSSSAASKSSPKSSYLRRMASNSRRNCSSGRSLLGTAALSSNRLSLTCLLGSLLVGSGYEARPSTGPTNDRATGTPRSPSVFTPGDGVPFRWLPPYRRLRGACHRRSRDSMGMP
jgi:hypothetical protein